MEVWVYADNEVDWREHWEHPTKPTILPAWATHLQVQIDRPATRRFEFSGRPYLLARRVNDLLAKTAMNTGLTIGVARAIQYGIPTIWMPFHSKNMDDLAERLLRYIMIGDKFGIELTDA
jgi:hypothetical protein